MLGKYHYRTTGELCNGDLQIVRSWIATDNSGNVSEPCPQVITITRTAVDFAAVDVEIECTDYAANNALTDPANTGFPLGVSNTACMYNYDYEDEILASCGTSFKIVRTWTILDWCTGQLVTTDADGDACTYGNRRM